MVLTDMATHGHSTSTMDDREVFKQWRTGGCSPRLPNAPHPTTSLLSLPANTTIQFQWPTIATPTTRTGTTIPPHPPTPDTTRIRTSTQVSPVKRRTRVHLLTTGTWTGVQATLSAFQGTAERRPVEATQTIAISSTTRQDLGHRLRRMRRRPCFGPGSTSTRGPAVLLLWTGTLLSQDAPRWKRAVPSAVSIPVLRNP